MNPMKFIYMLSARYKLRYPQYDIWSFIGAGWIGYYDAQRLYNENKGMKFSSFAFEKINYAMLTSVKCDKDHRFFIDPSDICDCKQIEHDVIESKKIRESISKLNRRQADIVNQYFYRDYTHRKIGERYGLSEHRISQIKKEALRRLKGRLIRKGITG